MMITERYSYEKISRKQIEGRRLYTTPKGDAVPSVTTILDKTKSEETVIVKIESCPNILC